MKSVPGSELIEALLWQEHRCNCTEVDGWHTVLIFFPLWCQTAPHFGVEVQLFQVEVQFPDASIIQHCNLIWIRKPQLQFGTS